MSDAPAKPGRLLTERTETKTRVVETTRRVELTEEGLVVELVDQPSDYRRSQFVRATVGRDRLITIEIGGAWRTTQIELEPLEAAAFGQLLIQRSGLGPPARTSEANTAAQSAHEQALRVRADSRDPVTGLRSTQPDRPTPTSAQPAATDDEINFTEGQMKLIRQMSAEELEKLSGVVEAVRLEAALRKLTPAAVKAAIGRSLAKSGRPSPAAL